MSEITQDILDAAQEAFGGDIERNRQIAVLNLNKKQRLVYDAIQKYPRAADDDALLLAVVWQEEGWNSNISVYDNLKNVSRPETLYRRRRELFNMGLIEYSPKAKKERTEAFKNERDQHSHYMVRGMINLDTGKREDIVEKVPEFQSYEQGSLL